MESGGGGGKEQRLCPEGPPVVWGLDSAVAIPEGPVWEGAFYQEREREGNGPSLSADHVLRKATENNAMHFKNGQRFTGTCKPKEN